MLETLLQLWPTSLTSQALLVGAVVGAVVYWITRKRYNMPPAPRGWPLLGNLLDVIGSKKMFTLIDGWSKELGPVLSVNMGPMTTIFLCRIDVVWEALVKRQADFAGRPKSFATEHLFGNGDDILSANYGPRWKLHRKLVSKAIRQYLMGGLLNKTLSKSVSISTGLMLKQEGPFDPFPYITLSVFNILNSMCFDKFSSDVTDEAIQFYVGGLDRFSKEFGNGLTEDFIPPLRLCPTGKFKRIKRLFDDLNDRIQEEVNQHKKTFQKGVSRDFTDSLLLVQEEAKDEEDPGLLSQITDRHLYFTISNVFFAGIDTSRNTLHWTLLVMCLHSEVQQKVHQEVDAVIGPDLQIRQDMREHLPYTEAVLFETMRLRPVAPTGVPHSTLKDTTVGGYELPKGTMVMINHHSLHMDPDQWNQPEEFRPERFLDASGKMAPKPDSWLPFSAGRRVCLGETLARPELHLILAGIMRACSVELAPGDETDMEPLDNGIAFNSPKRYKITARSRL